MGQKASNPLRPQDSNSTVYTTLPLTSQTSIRLFKLLPNSDPQQTICIQVRVFELKSTPAYCALSYEWGAKQPMKLLRCNGSSLEVRPNLWNALCAIKTQLDAPSQGVMNREWFWVDALSIDQTDIRERSHQVGLMSAIYSQAADVLVWIPYCSSQAIAADIRDHPKSGDDHECQDWCPRPEQFMDLLQLLKHTYWQRLWILQETQLARQLHLLLEDNLLSWHDFAAYARCTIRRAFAEMSGLGDLYIRSAGFKVIEFCRTSERRHLVDAIIHWRRQNCQDPRDRIFALLSITDAAYDGSGQRISADYTQSLEDIYCRLIHGPTPTGYRELLRGHRPHYMKLQQALGIDERNGAVIAAVQSERNGWLETGWDDAERSGRSFKVNDMRRL